MNSKEDFKKAQENAEKMLKKVAARSSSNFKLSIEHIYKVLNEQLTTKDKLDYLRIELSELLQFKIEIRERIEKENSISNQINFFYPEEEMIKEVEQFIRRMIQDYESIEKLEALESEEKLTLKQQILLIEALGLLDNQHIKGLDTSKKAKLFAALLNRHEQNIRELLTYLGGAKKDLKPKLIVNNESNVEVVGDLLESLGLKIPLKVK